MVPLTSLSEQTRARKLDAIASNIFSKNEPSVRECFSAQPYTKPLRYRISIVTRVIFSRKFFDLKIGLEVLFFYEFPIELSNKSIYDFAQNFDSLLARGRKMFIHKLLLSTVRYSTLHFQILNKM